MKLSCEVTTTTRYRRTAAAPKDQVSNTHKNRNSDEVRLKARACEVASTHTHHMYNEPRARSAQLPDAKYHVVEFTKTKTLPSLLNKCPDLLPS